MCFKCCSTKEGPWHSCGPSCFLKSWLMAKPQCQKGKKGKANCPKSGSKREASRRACN